MNERTDHAAEARQQIEWVHEWQSAEGVTPETGIASVLLAQAEATLALVEQQRIANIFTLQSGVVNGTGVPRTENVFDYDERGYMIVKPEIAAALGINPEGDPR